MTAPIQKCAIYTRKSTEKGLEQDFNSLHAQRDACLAYITSQKSEGWIASKQIYDDGGYSGGNIDRPALQQLLADVKTGNINIIVVYKIDRLTRSLADFANLVEVFDQYGVSFVSVTQSFNTTTSMGRLTLNVLLSFAQFEREVSGERIRDKIAASKKKGMWMGRCAMLGYDIKDRRLIINEPEAESVRYIFDSYLEFGTIFRLKEYLDIKGIRSKAWISTTGRKYGGTLYGRGALYHLLKNPIYAGYIRQKDTLHEGLHTGIISKEKWQQVQELMISNASADRGHKKQSEKNILQGKIFDTDAALYTPTRGDKRGKQYRYYVSHNCAQNRARPKDVIGRLPAHEIETLILNTLTEEMRDIKKLSAMLQLDVETSASTLEQISRHVDLMQNLHTAINKVTVDVSRLTIHVSLKSIATCISETMGIALAINDAATYALNIPYHTKRSRMGAVVLMPGDGKDFLDLPKKNLEYLVKGIIWRDEHFGGKSFIEIARENNCSRTYVQQLIHKSFRIA